MVQEDRQRILFDDSWNKVGETIFAKQRCLALKDLSAWELLGWNHNRLFIKPAYIRRDDLAYASHAIGRVIQPIEDWGRTRSSRRHSRIVTPDANIAGQSQGIHDRRRLSLSIGASRTRRQRAICRT